LRIHIVQKGDILSDLAKKYNVSLEDIVNLNPQLSSPDMIMPGMKIKIPSESKQVRKDQLVSDDKSSPARKDVRVKETKVEKVKERDAKVVKRPMGDIGVDDRKESKPIKAEIPRHVERLYPVSPMSKRKNMEEVQHKVTKEYEKVKATPPKKEFESMDQQVKAQSHYRPIHRSQPTEQPMYSMPSTYPPVMHQQQMIYGCCCHCRQPIFVPREQYHQSMYSHPGGYDNRFTPYMNGMYNK